MWFKYCPFYIKKMNLVKYWVFEQLDWFWHTLHQIEAHWRNRPIVTVFLGLGKLSFLLNFKAWGVGKCAPPKCFHALPQFWWTPPWKLFNINKVYCLMQFLGIMLFDKIKLLKLVVSAPNSYFLKKVPHNFFHKKESKNVLYLLICKKIKYPPQHNIMIYVQFLHMYVNDGHNQIL